MKKFLLCICLFISVLSYTQTNEFYLFVGTYTSGKSEGIYVYKFNANDGSVKFISNIKTYNPSYLTTSADEKFVYSVNQNGNDKPNETSAFNFNKQTGALSFINKQNVNGVGPCYITVDKNNTWLFTANYTSGSLSALPINKDGSIGELKQLIKHEGNSSVKGRQDAAHVHTTVFSPDEKYLFVTDLGMDKITRYNFNSTSSQPLTTTSDSLINSFAGNGPRHIAFHPNNKFVYVINELSGTIDAFNYKNNKTKLLQTISTDTSNRKDKGSGDIHISPDGKFLYASNRGNDNTISAFRIDKKGKLALIDVQSTQGKTPRNFMIDPTGNYVLVANQNSNSIIVFKRNLQTGLLQLTDTKIDVGNPSCLKMINVE
jgi:6-phosphogluconolactonase